MLALFLLFVIVPLFTALGLSFFSWRFLNTPTWVGLDNFEHILRDRALPHSVLVTGLFVAMGVLPTILIGFVLSVLINVKLRGIALLRMLYFVPIVVSVSVNAVLWRFIYDTRRGPLGAIGRQLGLDLPSVLDTTQWALPGLVVIMVWAGLPLVIIFYLAALQRIPEDLYAAAALDGAGSWRMMWSITWPNVASTTWLLLVLEIVFFSAGSLRLRASHDGWRSIGRDHVAWPVCVQDGLRAPRRRLLKRALARSDGGHRRRRRLALPRRACATDMTARRRHDLGRYVADPGGRPVDGVPARLPDRRFAHDRRRAGSVPTGDRARRSPSGQTSRGRWRCSNRAPSSTASSS